MTKIFWFSTLVVMLGCTTQKSNEHDHVAVAKPLYTCPMHPNVVQEAPGKCPACGMDLVPLTQSASADNTLMLTDNQIRLANITTQKVTMRNIGQTTVVNGKLAVNEERTELISSRAAGRIEKLYAKETGRSVKQGEPLYELYSEALLTLQQEYLLAKEQYESMGKEEKRYENYMRGAEQKLLLYGLSKAQLAKLDQTKKTDNRITFFAPASGIISTIDVTEGQYITEGALLYKIENTQQLWVEAELYPNEIQFAKRGVHVKVSVVGFEGTPIDATINFLSPEYKAGSQITIMRASIGNPEMNFKPGMQTQVVFSHSEQKALVVPVDAVIRDDRGNHVYIQTESNTFQARRVKTGIENSEWVEITEGLQENDIVAFTGAFLLYSEIILKKGTDPMVEHDH